MPHFEEILIDFYNMSDSGLENDDPLSKPNQTEFSGWRMVGLSDVLVSPFGFLYVRRSDAQSSALALPDFLAIY